MSPVVLIGLSKEDGKITAVGLYETAELAREAVQRGDVRLPSFITICTPAMNSLFQAREPEVVRQPLKKDGA